MKRCAGILTLVVLLMPVAFAQSLADGPGQPPQQVRPRAQAAIEDVVQGVFIAQFQQQVQVTDEQFVKVLPLLRTGIQTMRANAERSLRATNLLAQAIRRNAPEEELNTHIREFDEADRLSKANQQSFITRIDPFLSSAQKARLRVFQSMFDQRLRDLVQRARQLNQPGRQQEPTVP